MLRGSPARLLSPEDVPNREMERIQRILDQDYKAPQKILELNRGHTLIANLAWMVDERPADPLIAPLIEQLYDSALLVEGLHPNPAEMVERIQTLMEAAARGARAED
jgi:molecular chaperone HtpG